MKKNILYVVILVVFFVLIVKVVLYATNTSLAYIGSRIYAMEVADDKYARSTGLSGRSILGDRKGMLFVFGDKQEREFWMKDMNFDLDFLWIEDNRIVGISKNVPAPRNNDGEIAKVKIHYPINKVIEINSGLIDRYNIKIGDRVLFF